MPSPFYGTTPRLGLRKLLGGSNGSDIDAGFDALASDADTKLIGYSEGLHSARPAASVANRIYRETDTGSYFFDNGSAWQQIVISTNGSEIGIVGAAGATLDLEDTSAGSNAKRARLLDSGGTTFLQAVNDAYSAAFTALSFPNGSTPIVDFPFGAAVDAPILAGRAAAKASAFEILKAFNVTDGQDWSLLRPAGTRDLQLYSSVLAGAAFQFLQNGMFATPASLVSTLPSSPVDGQVCDLLVDAANGVVWRLRYHAGSVSAYKWEFVGGPPLYAEVTATQTLTVANATPTDLGTVGPAITIPTLPSGGDFDVTVGAAITGAAGGAGPAGNISYAIGGTGAVTVDGAQSGDPNGTSAIRTRRKPAIASATVLTAKYSIMFAGGGSAQFGSRFISVLPVRVG